MRSSKQKYVEQPITREGLSDLRDYVAQLKAKLLSDTAPEPDLRLLTGHPHGPFRSLETGPHILTGGEGVLVSLQDPDRKPRWMPGPVALLLRLVVASGGNLLLDGNGKGLGYLKLFTRTERVTLKRVVMNPSPGQKVMLRSPSGQMIDHHYSDPDYMTIVTARRVSPERVPLSRPTKRGRAEAFATAERLFVSNGCAAILDLMPAQYAALLLEAASLLDAWLKARFKLKGSLEQRLRPLCEE